jgi:hypothetical protein
VAAKEYSELPDCSSSRHSSESKRGRVPGGCWGIRGRAWIHDGWESGQVFSEGDHSHHHFAFWGRKMEVEMKQRIGRKQSRRIHQPFDFFQMTRRPRKVPPCSQPCGSFSPHSRLELASAAEGRRADISARKKLYGGRRRTPMVQGRLVYASKGHVGCVTADIEVCSLG